MDTAAANGKHGGRPSAVDGDMLAGALRRRDAKDSVTAIARHLGIGRCTLYRTFAAYDRAIATGQEPAEGPQPRLRTPQRMPHGATATAGRGSSQPRTHPRW
ncbi:helix-turn-helix domain-containing protein [Streptomyces sp. A0592]|uniref:helix-turn-helix domain-containing protein n=1 Tax=Streptomyces sp. A0592 TaxID=2563099 RepID=UPI00109EB3B7|nr:helix-turn-helix domain-containing protein [Streptomyces sp. A0592]THA74880.1 hypothetical protein E6U81_37310 [Streptomyces sp. A0592]